MHKLFSGLIWPAIAGNVAWALFTVAILEGISFQTFPRLLSLTLVAGYLMLSWCRERVVENPGSYYMLDTLFAASIITFAIFSASNDLSSKPHTSISLLAIFLSSSIGHLCAIWDSKRNKIERRWLGVANLSGVAVVALSFCVDERLRPWLHSLAVAIVISWWFCLLKKYHKDEGQPFTGCV